jgi:hypothetical protein
MGALPAWAEKDPRLWRRVGSGCSAPGTRPRAPKRGDTPKCQTGRIWRIEREGSEKVLMSIPRKHHYIPVFYLKQWAGADRHVCEYRRVREKNVTRRKFPDGTGYKKDLYRIEGMPGPVAQMFESSFMHWEDTQASYALKKIVGGDLTPWDGKMRSAWTRFILSLRFRNPESVSIIKRQVLNVWNATVDNLRINYNKPRCETDPATFEEFMARTEPEAPHKAALILLRTIIDNPRVGPGYSECTGAGYPWRAPALPC